MKKITKILILMILLLTLISCKDAPHRELFNELYDNNFKIAEETYNSTIGHMEEKFNCYVIKYSKILNSGYYQTLFQYYKALECEGIDRVILSELSTEETIYLGLEVIEFKTVEEAEKMMAEVNSANAIFVRYENIVYNLNAFGPAFIYGKPNFSGAFYYNTNKDVLYAVPESRYKAETLKIQNNVKYIVKSAIIYNDYIKEIICGENLEKIGAFAMQNNENLECFVANEKLKVINNYALTQNPKLKTVVLNDGLEYIGEKAFYGCESLKHVVIPESVKYIEYEAFTSGILYCEIESKPEGWDNDFVTDNVKVYWGNEWEYNEDGIPVLIEK